MPARIKRAVRPLANRIIFYALAAAPAGIGMSYLTKFIFRFYLEGALTWSNFFDYSTLMLEVLQKPSRLTVCVLAVMLFAVVQSTMIYWLKYHADIAEEQSGIRDTDLLLRDRLLRFPFRLKYRVLMLVEKAATGWLTYLVSFTFGPEHVSLLRFRRFVMKPIEEISDFEALSVFVFALLVGSLVFCVFGIGVAPHHQRFKDRGDMNK